MSQGYHIDYLERELDSARIRVAELQNSIRANLDKLIDDKVSKPVEPSTAPPTNMESLQMRRPSWGKVRAAYEAKSREAYWKSQIEAVEQADREAGREADREVAQDK